MTSLQTDGPAAGDVALVWGAATRAGLVSPVCNHRNDSGYFTVIHIALCMDGNTVYINHTR